MQLTKSLQNAVHFAQLCQAPHVTPHKLAILITLVRRRVRAYERYNNQTGTAAADDKAVEAVVAAADKIGLEVDYPGLYPVLTVRATGEEIYSLPCL